MVKNLTEGKPLKLLFFFALPMVAGNLFQQLYNMVDTAVVGKFVGEDAVAAVGSSFPVVFLSVAVASGLSMGCNVVVSQLFGAGRIHEMKSTVSTAIISLSVLGLIIMGLGTLFAGPLLELRCRNYTAYYEPESGTCVFRTWFSLGDRGGEAQEPAG